ncbi:hypothetical protein R6Q57_018731 [Mikania cordata]
MPRTTMQYIPYPGTSGRKTLSFELIDLYPKTILLPPAPPIQRIRQTDLDPRGLMVIGK